MWCKQCQREYSREHYKRNKGDHLARRHKNKYGERKKKRAVVDAAKLKPCFDCGITYPTYVLHFDHRDPAEKLFTIGSEWPRKTIAQILSEIEKCDVVCANCHAERTWGNG